MKVSNKDWEDLLENISKGDILSGEVTEVRNFGVFVDLGFKFKGLVLVPHITNEILGSIEDYPQVNEKYLFKVLDFSKNEILEHSYISLCMRDDFEN